MKYCFSLALALVCVAVHPAPAKVRTEELARQAEKAIIYRPAPAYPLQARENGWTGKGKFQLRVRVSTGRVLAVTMVKSTGHAVLDKAALGALKEWRFRPGALPALKVANPKRNEPWAVYDSLIVIPLRFSLGEFDR